MLYPFQYSYCLQSVAHQHRFRYAVLCCEFLDALGFARRHTKRLADRRFALLDRNFVVFCFHLPSFLKSPRAALCLCGHLFQSFSRHRERHGLFPVGSRDKRDVPVLADHTVHLPRIFAPHYLRCHLLTSSLSIRKTTSESTSRATSNSSA